MNLAPVVIGIDADTRRIAYAVHDGGDTFRAVSSFERAKTSGRIVEAYDATLTTLILHAIHAGAVIYLEGIYLPERRDDTKTTQRRNVQTF